MATARLLDDIKGNDLVLLFADNPDHPTVRPARSAALAATPFGPAVFGCYRTGPAASPHETVWHTGVQRPLAALTVQTVGHLLLRSVRAATLLLDDERGLDLRHPDKAWQPVAPQHARPVR